MDRLDNAQVEKDAARAGFGYRYIVTLPPVFPRRPEKPQTSKVMVGALVAALALAALMALLADLRSRRVLETWQIERLLGLRVLGELDES
jgi:capsular polysaccharide biosynthesis protein